MTFPPSACPISRRKVGGAVELAPGAQLLGWHSPRGTQAICKTGHWVQTPWSCLEQGKGVIWREKGQA